MIHLSKNLVKRAKEFLDVKSLDDDIKASHDVETIKSTLDNARPTFEYIQSCKILHNTINEDYPEIREMHRVASEMISVSGMKNEEIYSEYEAIQQDLVSDMFGIYASVLLKHEDISCMKDFIDSVD